MSTIEDFENAPVGATATNGDGSRAMKTRGLVPIWVTSNGIHLYNDEVEQRGYELDLLPNPKPDWLDAPAVLARLDGWSRDQRVVFFPRDDHPDRWVWSDTDSTRHWSELCDVTPLYPEGKINASY